MFSDLSWFTFPSPVGEQDWGEEEDLPTLQNDSAKTSNGRYLRVPLRISSYSSQH